MKTLASKLITLATAALWFSGAQAIPSLQVDILGGEYCDSACDETVVTRERQFTVYAYGGTEANNGGMVNASGTYYLAVALAPQTYADADFGSFMVNGTTYTSDDLVYGTPPMELLPQLQVGDANDLASHGVYETMFLQLAFNWNTSATRSAVNVQDNAGTDPTASAGNALYYVGFDVDLGGLASDYQLHFDLYSADVDECGRALKNYFGGTLPSECADVDVDDFAPFSHDAASVPEPTTLALLGLGLVGLGFARRRS